MGVCVVYCHEALGTMHACVFFYTRTHTPTYTTHDLWFFAIHTTPPPPLWITPPLIFQYTQHSPLISTQAANMPLSFQVYISAINAMVQGQRLDDAAGCVVVVFV